MVKKSLIIHLTTYVYRRILYCLSKKRWFSLTAEVMSSYLNQPRIKVSLKNSMVEGEKVPRGESSLHVSIGSSFTFLSFLWAPRWFPCARSAPPNSR